MVDTNADDDQAGKAGDDEDDNYQDGKAGQDKAGLANSCRRLKSAISRHRPLLSSCPPICYLLRSQCWK